MNIEDDLKILETAKLLSNTNDIDRIIEVANKIRAYLKFGPPVPAIDILDFAKKCVIQHPMRGAIQFLTYPFQEDALNLLAANHKFTLLNTSRQMGMTTLLAVYALFEAATKPNQAIMIVSNRLASAVEIMDRIRFAMTGSSLMLPSVVELNKTTISFNNGSRIFARAASADAVKGCTLTHILIDQAAFISYKIFDSFWLSIQPCLSVGSKVVVQSTPRYAEGKFYDMCRMAPQNGAHYMVVPWHKHPERNEAWAEPYRQNLGERAWRSEFECEFILPESE